jgi:hypothetical protein
MHGSISCPADWAELVGRYPIDVSRSRRHDWWRATGWAGRWLVPDFAAVAPPTGWNWTKDHSAGPSAAQERERILAAPSV